ncbi:MAG: hypothetical protein ACL93V_02065 [Candidatus Electrothrix sp. YB6]
MKYQKYLTIFILLSGLFGSACPAVAEKALQFIVNYANPNESIALQNMKKMFIGRGRTWPKSKKKVALVDLPDDSPIRKEFSEKVLGRSVAQMEIHWQKRIFAARGRAPKKMANEQEAIKYMAKKSGGLGYLAGKTETSEPDIKELDVESIPCPDDINW